MATVLTSRSQRAQILQAGMTGLHAVEVPKIGRSVRSPRHDFMLRHKPFQLQPFCVVPVLPGDTMKNALLQASAYTDPIKNPLLGWWLEHFLFYVPFRAMKDISTHLQNMALDPGFGELNAAGDIAAANWLYHAHAADPSFVHWATKAVVEEFFRDEGEDWLTNAHIDNVPQIGISRKKSKFMHSFVLDSDTTEPDTLPGQYDQDGSLDEWFGSGSTDFAGAYDAYQALVAAQMVDATYEDFLKSYGVRVPTKPSDEPPPELLRYGKAWKYPSRTVDDEDGSLSNMVQWRTNMRADKDRRFKEPGVLLGLTCASPKIYLRRQVQVGVDSLKTSLSWLPSVLQEHAFTSLKMFTSNGTDTGNGPLGFTPSADYWLDVRDLFAYGDQFVNFSLASTDAGLVALPNAAGRARFVSAQDIADMFVGETPACLVHQEGVMQFTLAGQVKDMTP